MALPPAPVIAAETFGWGGFYGGVHGAWVRSEGEAVRASAAPARPFPRRTGLDDDDFGGGGQIGFLTQWGDTVAGLEADITGVGIGRTRTSIATFPALPPRLPAVATRLGSEMDSIGTVKGRIGFSFSGFLPFVQHAMVYATGGLGYADIHNRVQVSAASPGIGTARVGARGDDMKLGFVVGGGTENAITNTVSIKTETLYYDLEDETVGARAPGMRARYRFGNDGWISRVGLNVRFGGS